MGNCALAPYGKIRRIKMGIQQDIEDARVSILNRSGCITCTLGGDWLHASCTTSSSLCPIDVLNKFGVIVHRYAWMINELPDPFMSYMCNYLYEQVMPVLMQVLEENYSPDMCSQILAELDKLWNEYKNEYWGFVKEWRVVYLKRSGLMNSV